MKRLLVLALPALALSVSAPLFAKEGADKPTDQELRDARRELERARDELRRAAESLARLTYESDHDSPRARAWEMMVNPRRAMLGVTIDDPPEKNGEVRGVLLTGVTPGSGADKAGLKSGDILLAANGKDLAARAGADDDPQHKLREIMRGLEPGDAVKLEYERAGKRATTTVTASRPEPMHGMLDWDDDGDFDVVIPPIPPIPPVPAVPPVPPVPSVVMRRMEGDMQLARLDPDLAPYFHTDKGVLVVTAPRAGSLGLKSGDVIQKVDGDAVDSPMDVWDRFTDAGTDDRVKVDVVRQGRSMNLEGTLPDTRRRIIRRKLEVREDGDDKP